jgi:hypothetical protein
MSQKDIEKRKPKQKLFRGSPKKDDEDEEPFVENPQKFRKFLSTVPRKEQPTYLADAVLRCKERCKADFEEISNIIDFLYTMKENPDKPEKLGRILHSMVWEDPNCKAAVDRVIAAIGRSQYYGHHTLMNEEHIINILVQISMAIAQGIWKGPEVNQYLARTDPVYFQQLCACLMVSQRPLIIKDPIERGVKQALESLEETSQTM